jgi:hypothetical protein
MKTLLALTLFTLAALPSFAFGPRTVHSYNKKNGTHVESYRRTSANRSQRDNYSSKGNVNPYTGKPGTKTPKN